MWGILVLLASFAFILWLFLMDLRFRDAGSKTLWIPGLWLVIIASRPVAYWLNLHSAGGDIEGSPINLVVQGLLICGALLLLIRAGFDWRSFFSQNKALIFIYLFFLVSALWSPVHVATIKRIVKDFGCVLAALVFLLQEDPGYAVRVIFVRVSYLVFPLSLVLCKYFPSIGRLTSNGGETMFAGVTTHKNTLGQVVMVLSLMIVWDLVELYKTQRTRARNLQIRIHFGMLLIGLWLLSLAQCATVNACLPFGLLLMWGAARLARMRQGKALLIASLAAGVALIGLNKTFDLSTRVALALGRTATMSGRTEIWQELLDQHIHPVLGYGYFAFWDTPASRLVQETLGTSMVTTAHNGYLEIFLDGGWVGIGFLAIMLLAHTVKSINKLFNGDPFGGLAIVFCLITLIYNNSESDYFRLEPLWFTFLLVTINYFPRQQDSGPIESFNLWEAVPES